MHFYYHKLSKISYYLIISIIFFFLPINTLNAQTEPGFKPFSPTEPEPETLPPLEKLLPEIQPQNKGEANELPSNETQTIFVKKFVIRGSTVFSPEELANILQPYTQRRLSFNEILAAQQAINRLYIDNGYITSGSFIPPQKLEDGIITIEVIEGSVEQINIQGLNRLNPNYVRSRLEIATQPPVNRDKLLNALQMLQLDPLISSISAELAAGSQAGSSILEVQLQQADPFDLILSYDNYRAPSVGTDRRQVQLIHRNLLGLGDKIDVKYVNTDGSNAIDNLTYTLPVNAYNGTLEFTYGYSDNDIIEEPFNQLDINSVSEKYELTYRQPILQKPTEDLTLGLTFSHQDIDSSLLGQRFGLSPGSSLVGETDVSVIRFFQEYTNRNARQVLALRSQFNVGIDAFGSTINDSNLPDSKFFAWQLQGQYLRLLTEDVSFLFRSNLQLSDRRLLATEQYSLGGIYTVRGYRQDLLLGDNGFSSTVEMRANVLKIPEWEANLQITPFVDVGTVWNNDNVKINNNTLVSTGVGLRLEISDYFAARLDWGIPLVDIENSGDTLQEDGIYFSLELKPF